MGLIYLEEMQAHPQPYTLNQNFSDDYLYRSLAWTNALKKDYILVLVAEDEKVWIHEAVTVLVVWALAMNMVLAVVAPLICSARWSRSLCR